MSGVIGVLVALLLTLVLGWLTVRAWRLRNTAARVVLGLVSTIVTLVVAAVGIVGIVGAYRLYTPHGGPAPNMTARATPDQLAVATRRVSGCTGCHSSTGQLPLDGGNVNFLGGPPGASGSGGPPPPGVLVPPNLTPGGRLRDWTDAEIARAIREGVDRDGHPLLIMPSEAFHYLADEDVMIVVAQLRSQPAVDHPTPARDINLLGLLLVGAGVFPTSEQPHMTQPQTAPPPGVTPAYGRYLVDITGCAVCHGQNLSGGTPGGFGPPAGPNLRAIVSTWSDADFVKFFRTGQDPGGRKLDASSPMPWEDIGKSYTDDELRAMHAYLRSLT